MRIGVWGRVAGRDGARAKHVIIDAMHVLKKERYDNS